MPTLYIRGVPTEVVEALRRRAGAHRRSLNAEAVDMLTAATRSRRPLDEVLASIQENAAAIGLTDSDVDVDVVELIEAGRNERNARVLGE